MVHEELVSPGSSGRPKPLHVTLLGTQATTRSIQGYCEALPRRTLHLWIRPTLLRCLHPRPVVALSNCVCVCECLDRYVGASVTLTAMVAPSAASGTVTFYSGTTVLGSTALSSGTAALSTSFSSAQTASVIAVYSGDSSYGGSTSSALNITVSAVVGTKSSSTALSVLYNSNHCGYLRHIDSPGNTQCSDRDGDLLQRDNLAGNRYPQQRHRYPDDQLQQCSNSVADSCLRRR